MNLNVFDNVITGSYDDMTEAWDKAVGELDCRAWRLNGGGTTGEWSHFSMYDSIPEVGAGDFDELYKYPDFEANPLICEGELEVEISDWNGAKTTLTNPRINDVFRFFANNHDGHHGFIEGVDLKDGKLVIYSGS